MSPLIINLGLLSIDNHWHNNQKYKSSLTACISERMKDSKIKLLWNYRCCSLKKEIVSTM